MATMSDAERIRLAGLRGAFAALPALADKRDGEPRWLSNNRRLHELVLDDDPRRFLTWDVIQRTMVTGDAEFIGTELAFVRAARDRARWDAAMCETPVGQPSPSPLYRESSGNLIHYAYHLRQFEANTGVTVEDHDVVFEFGGGYGGLCRLAHNLGFSGRYIIYDFPRFSHLQSFYLQSAGIPVVEPGSSRPGAQCVSDAAMLTRALSGTRGRQMFIATWSLSEAPIDIREQILPLVERFDSFLIAYQGLFEGNDNVKFFADWSHRMAGVRWYGHQIDHIPNDYYRDNFYLIGSRT